MRRSWALCAQRGMSLWRLGAIVNAPQEEECRLTSEAHIQVPSRVHDVTSISLPTPYLTRFSFTLKWHSYDTTIPDEDHDSVSLIYCSLLIELGSSNHTLAFLTAFLFLPIAYSRLLVVDILIHHRPLPELTYGGCWATNSA